ncbi:glutathione S-transferase family protein [Polyangium jinanense]|uniref:Glutathione S-transferase family protein n=1 Tax=Polyangium jinanense TaxID=2829994 RepID=A0A9X4AX34_9BACT|nr:glutathione S-transferase family protein [Polyangium jinanense]MDC3961051.1 glutathione S-transferase family protein [Polyangium jinanense]MDC3987471.1 glutathione S-transferase family protein [Polyangium jinanense]
MKLCGFRISNYHNKVRLALLEKGIPHEEDPSCFPSQDPEYLARSPMGRVPVLETPHGVVCESQVICEYLEEVYPDNPLYPRDPFARAKVRELIQIFELNIELVARRTYPSAFMGASLTDEAKAAIKADLAKGVRAFLQLAKFDPFVAGSAFTLADCAVAVHYPLVSLATQRVFGADVFAEVPQVVAYVERIGQRPHVARVREDSREAFAQLMAKRRG